MYSFQPKLFSKAWKLDRLSFGCVCRIDDVRTFIDNMAQNKLECLSFIKPGYVMLLPQPCESQTKKKVHTLEVYTSLPWKCIQAFFKLFTVDKLVLGYPLFHSYPVHGEDLAIDVNNAHVVSRPTI